MNTQSKDPLVSRLVGLYQKHGLRVDTLMDFDKPIQNLTLADFGTDLKGFSSVQAYTEIVESGTTIVPSIVRVTCCSTAFATTGGDVYRVDVHGLTSDKLDEFELMLENKHPTTKFKFLQPMHTLVANPLTPKNVISPLWQKWLVDKGVDVDKIQWYESVGEVVKSSADVGLVQIGDCELEEFALVFPGSKLEIHMADSDEVESECFELRWTEEVNRVRSQLDISPELKCCLLTNGQYMYMETSRDKQKACIATNCDLAKFYPPTIAEFEQIMKGTHPTLKPVWAVAFGYHAALDSATVDKVPSASELFQSLKL